MVAVVCLNLSESTETLPHQWCLGDLRIWGLQFCVAGTRKRKGAKVDEHRAVAPASLSGLDRLGTRRRPLAARAATVLNLTGPLRNVRRRQSEAAAACCCCCCLLQAGRRPLVSGHGFVLRARCRVAGSAPAVVTNTNQLTILDPSTCYGDQGSVRHHQSSVLKIFFSEFWAINSAVSVIKNQEHGNLSPASPPPHCVSDSHGVKS